MITIRSAQETDFWPLTGVGRRFLAESHQFSLTWDDETAWKFFHAYITLDDRAFFVVTEDNPNEPPIIHGYAIINVRADYTVEKCAFLDSFYIIPESRSGTSAVRLLQRCIDYAKQEGAVLLYAATTAGFFDEGVNNKAMARLYKHAGLEPFGEFFVGDLRSG